MPTPSKALAVGMAACLLLLAALGGSAMAARSTKRVNASAPLKALVKQTGKLPNDAASGESEGEAAAHRARCRRCRQAASLQGGEGPVGISQNPAHDAHPSVGQGQAGDGPLARPPRRARPGVVEGEQKAAGRQAHEALRRRRDPVDAEDRQTTVLKSDENGMHAARPAAGARVRRADRRRQKLDRSSSLPNTDAPGADGTPGIPVVSSTFGVPDGAKVEVVREQLRVVRDRRRRRVPEPAGAAPTLASNDPKPNFLKPPFATKPFTIDKAAYREDGLVPPDAGRRPGPRPGARHHDRRAADPGGAVRRGRPQAEGAQHGRRESHVRRRRQDVQRRAELAVGALAAGPGRRAHQQEHHPSKLGFILRRCGEEMLVITNPATAGGRRPVRDRQARAGLAHERRSRSAADAGQIGTTPTADPGVHPRPPDGAAVHPPELRHDHRRRRPRADVHRRARAGSRRICQYSLKTDADELPDVAVGRIIGNDQTAVATAVDEDPRLRDDRADRQRHAQQGARSPRSSRTTTTTGRRTARSSSSPRRCATGSPPAASRSTASTARARQQPAEIQRRHAAAGGAAEADVRVGRHRRAGHRRLERGPLHGRAPRPRLVGRLGHARLRHGRRAGRSRTARCCRSC